MSPLAWGFVITLVTVCMCLVLVLYFAMLTMTDGPGSNMHKVSARGGRNEMAELGSDDEAKVQGIDTNIPLKAIGLKKVKKN